MPNRNYNKGRAYEYKIKKRYEKLGYTVFRTAGSHSPADLIALRCLKRIHLNWNSMSLLDVVLIQCKTIRPVHWQNEPEIETFLKWARDLGCTGRFYIKTTEGQTCYDSKRGRCQIEGV